MHSRAGAAFLARILSLRARLQLQPTHKNAEDVDIYACTHCTSDQLLCGDLCVDPSTANEHCGECDNKCQQYSECKSGECECYAGYSLCPQNGSNECVKLYEDLDNCGACGVKCTAENFDNSDAIDSVGCDSGSCKLNKCKANYHIENNVCIADSINNCGGQNCSQKAGWKEGTCNKGTCQATLCEDGYHLDDDEVCQADTNSCCGRKCDPCSNNTYCNNGECSSGCGSLTVCGSECKNTQADPEYCGNCTTNCNTTVTNASSATCVSGACKASTCKTGYFLSGGKCLAQSTTSCGGINCSSLAGWGSGSCSTTGTCVATGCTAGYRLNSAKNRCEAETQDCCGSGCTPCGTGQICSSGVCADNCGSAKTNCGEVCVDLASDPNNCKACGAKCTTTQVPNATAFYCSNACKASACESGYHLYNGGCEIHSISNCGAHGLDCSRSQGWKTGTCSSAGVCQVSSCTAGNHVSGPVCMQDTDTCCGEACNYCGSNAYCKLGICTPYPNLVLCSTPGGSPFGELFGGHYSCDSPTSGQQMCFDFDNEGLTDNIEQGDVCYNGTSFTSPMGYNKTVFDPRGTYFKETLCDPDNLFTSSSTGKVDSNTATLCIRTDKGAYYKIGYIYFSANAARVIYTRTY